MTIATDLQTQLDAAFSVYIADKTEGIEFVLHPMVLDAVKKIYSAGFTAAYAAYALELARIKER